MSQGSDYYYIYGHICMCHSVWLGPNRLFFFDVENPQNAQKFTGTEEHLLLFSINTLENCIQFTCSDQSAHQKDIFQHFHSLTIDHMIRDSKCLMIPKLDCSDYRSEMPFVSIIFTWHRRNAGEFSMANLRTMKFRNAYRPLYIIYIESYVRQFDT